MSSNAVSNSWVAFLALVTGQIDRHLQQQVEFVLPENRILRSKIEGRVKLDDPQRISLATIAKPLLQVGMSLLSLWE